MNQPISNDWLIRIGLEKTQVQFRNLLDLLFSSCTRRPSSTKDDVRWFKRRRRKRKNRLRKQVSQRIPSKETTTI